MSGGLPRRRTDRVEDAVAVVLCGVGVVVLVVAALLGVMAHGSVAARAASEGAERSVVSATVTQIPGAPPVTDDLSPGSRRVLAAWTAPDGTARSGLVSAPISAEPGAVVPLWTDRAGTPARAPVSEHAAGLVSGVVGVLSGLLGCLLLYGVWRLVRLATGRRNAEDWERGWAEVEPTWSGRTPTA
jgi:hypothetical protein